MAESGAIKPTRAWRWTFLGLLVFALLMVAIAAQLWQEGRSGEAVGRIAPTFRLDTFEHGRIDTSAFRGEVVLVNFWGSWCVACHQEAADLQRLWERYRQQGVVFVGVAYLDTERDARAYLEHYGIDYPNGLDIAQRISGDFRIQGAPETFLIDRAGQIQYFQAGPIDERRLAREIESTLAAGA